MSDYRLREGWSTVGLLLLMLLCLAWSISVADWVPGLPVLVWVVILGGSLGVLVAKSHLPWWMAHALSGLAGLSWGAWLTSRVLVTEMRLPGSEAILEIDWRLQIWVGDLVTQGQSTVAHMLLLVLCLLLWLCLQDRQPRALGSADRPGIGARLGLRLAASHPGDEQHARDRA